MQKKPNIKNSRIRNRFQYPRVKSAVKTFNKKNKKDRSRTRQEFKHESDVNNIMRRYQETGLTTDPTAQGEMFYGDFSDVNSFQDVQNRILDIQENFMTLPSSVRTYFDNDPSKLMDFMNTLADNPENKKTAIELGLIKPSKPDDSQLKEKESVKEKESAPTESTKPDPESQG